MKFGLFTDVSAANPNAALSGPKGFASAQTLVGLGDYICEAERLGFHSVFIVEHHFTGNGQVSSALSVLAYLAGRTSKIRIGSGVVVLPWHNPVLLAEQIATIDQLSQGRYDWGIGKGYRPHEFEGFRISREEANERYEETLNFCLRAWSTRERFSHEGKFWKFDNIVIDPPIYQNPHPPIWIGSTTEATCVKAGKDGYKMLLDQIATPELIGKRIASYKAAAAEAGRTVPPQSIGVNRAMQLVDNDDELRAANEHRARLLEALSGQAGFKWASFTERTSMPSVKAADSDEAALIGYPEDIVAKLKALESQGVDFVMITDFSASAASLRRFAQEIMPHFA